MIGRYLGWLERERGLEFEGYDELLALVGRPTSRASGPRSGTTSTSARTRRTSACSRRATMPGAEWFPGATLNYAEHALGRDGDEDAVAVVAYSQTRAAARAHLRRAPRAGGACARRAAAARRRPRRPRRRLPAQHPRDAGGVPRDGEPRRDLGDLRAGVRRRAASSTGSASSSRRSCSRSAATATATSSIDRTRGGRRRSATGCRPSRHVVHVPYGERRGRRRASRGTSCSPSRRRSRSTPVPFAHPLCVLFSSGTTGLPKAIVHGHGGILLEHLKNHGLSWDLQPGDRLQWFTTTAWMMWNALVSTLLAARVDRDDRRQPRLSRPLASSGSWPRRRGRPSWASARRSRWRAARRAWSPAGRSTSRRSASFARPARPLPLEGYEWVYEQFGPERAAHRRQRRHRRVHRHRAGLSAAAGVGGRDLRRACSASTSTRSTRTASRSSASSASS